MPKSTSKHNRTFVMVFDSLIFYGRMIYLAMGVLRSSLIEHRYLRVTNSTIHQWEKRFFRSNCDLHRRQTTLHQDVLSVACSRRDTIATHDKFGIHELRFCDKLPQLLEEVHWKLKQVWIARKWEAHQENTAYNLTVCNGCVMSNKKKETWCQALDSRNHLHNSTCLTTIWQEIFSTVISDHILIP